MGNVLWSCGSGSDGNSGTGESCRGGGADKEEEEEEEDVICQECFYPQR